MTNHSFTPAPWSVDPETADTFCAGSYSYEIVDWAKEKKDSLTDSPQIIGVDLAIPGSDQTIYSKWEKGQLVSFSSLPLEEDERCCPERKKRDE